jgi:hypothetical protein
MKSTRPQGYRFSWRSHRSGRQTQKRSDLFNPFLIPSTSKTAARHGSVFVWPPALCFRFFRCSLLANFAVPKETIENGKSSQQTSRQQKFNSS